MPDLPESTIPRRPDGSLDTEIHLTRSRALRAACAREIVRRLLMRAQIPQTSRIIGTPTSVTMISMGRPSRQ
jgi:hypothetical protein